MTVEMDQRTQSINQALNQTLKQEIKKNKEIIITRLELIHECINIDCIHVL